MSQNQRSTSDSECADFGRMASESIFVTTRVIALSVSFGEKSCTSGVTRGTSADWVCLFKVTYFWSGLDPISRLLAVRFT